MDHVISAHLPRRGNGKCFLQLSIRDDDGRVHSDGLGLETTQVLLAVVKSQDGERARHILNLIWRVLSRPEFESLNHSSDLKPLEAAIRLAVHGQADVEVMEQLTLEVRGQCDQMWEEYEAERETEPASMSTFRQIAIEAARRSLAKLGLKPEEIRCEPVAKENSRHEADQVSFTVEFDSTGMISDPDVTVECSVNKKGEPHAVATCITHFRPGGQFGHRYPHTWSHFWIYQNEVSA